MPHPEFPTEGLRSFFERFPSLSAASDLEALVAMYASQVMVAGPNGALVVGAADLQRAVAARRQQLAAAGHRDTSLVGFDEMPLTDRYAMVRAQFQWRFDGGNVPAVTLPSTFIVDRGGESPRILVYINQQDVAGVLRQRGSV